MPAHDPRTESLSDFLRLGFPSQQEAVRVVWSLASWQVPGVLRTFPHDRRAALLACYAKEVYLTMRHYPDQLAQGRLFLTSCDPAHPELSTEYAHPYKNQRGHKDVVVGTGLPSFDYGYERIELRRDHRKPLFVPLSQLATAHMPERIQHFWQFRQMMGLASA